MDLSTLMPQDVIDEIVNTIYETGDIASLSTCSLAARPFYEPTRRCLFSTITLDSPNVITSLRQILEQNPRLSSHFRSLEIFPLSESIIRETVDILPALSHIRHLVLGDFTTFSLRRSLSIKTQKRLAAILQLPLLETLKISNILIFPASLLHIPQKLQQLTLRNIAVFLNASDPTVQPLLHLKSIHLHRIRVKEPWENASGLNAPNLRQILVRDPRSDVWRVIKDGGESVETVIWDDYVHGQTYPLMTLGGLPNVRHFCIVQNGDYEYEHHTQGPIQRILGDKTVSERLEIFTFVIGKVNVELTTIPFFVRSLILGETWTNLADPRQFPRLRRVTIHLLHEELPEFIGKDFHSVISQKLHLLVEAGILHITVSKKLEWSDFL